MEIAQQEMDIIPRQRVSRDIGGQPKVKKHFSLPSRHANLERMADSRFGVIHAIERLRERMVIVSIRQLAILSSHNQIRRGTMSS